MAAPVEHGNVIVLTVAADPIAATRTLFIQGIYAKAAIVVTDAAGNVIADMLAGGSISFSKAIPVQGLDATGTGPAYIYLS